MRLESLMSTGDAAHALGISRDALMAALRAGAPEPRVRIAGRRMFDQHDVDELGRWFTRRGRTVPGKLAERETHIVRPEGGPPHE